MRKRSGCSRPCSGWRATGAAVVLVTHKLNEVKRYADAVTIMRGGKTVATLDPTTATAAELDRAYGRPDRDRCRRARTAGDGETRLNVGALQLRARRRPASSSTT